MSSPIGRMNKQRKEAEWLSTRCLILGLTRGVFLVQVSKQREAVLSVASWSPGQQRVRLKLQAPYKHLEFSQSDAALDVAEEKYGRTPSYPDILEYALDTEIVAEVKRRGLTID